MSTEGILTSIESKVDGLRDHIDQKANRLAQAVNDLAVKVGKLSIKLDNIHSHYATKDDLGGVQTDMAIVRTDTRWVKWLLGIAITTITITVVSLVIRAWLLNIPIIGGVAAAHATRTAAALTNPRRHGGISYGHSHDSRHGGRSGAHGDPRTFASNPLHRAPWLR